MKRNSKFIKYLQRTSLHLVLGDLIICIFSKVKSYIHHGCRYLNSFLKKYIIKIEMIVEEQIYKDIKQEKINQVLSNGYKFMNLVGRQDEAQSISQLDQQRIACFSRVDHITLENNVNDFQSSSYLKVKKNQLFKKYSVKTPKMINQKFSSKSNYLIQKAESLKNQMQNNKDTFNKPSDQGQADNRKISERTLSSQILKKKFFNIHELTLQNQENNTILQQQKPSSQNKSQTSRKLKLDNQRKLQSILCQKQKKLQFFEISEDKSSKTKNQIRQRQLIVRTVTYILFLVAFVCMKIILDNYC